MLKLKNFRIMIENQYDKMWIDRIAKSCLQEYKINGRDVNVHHCLTDAEKREIDDYFMTYYGAKIPYTFHEVYKSYNGQFDVKYFPEHLYESRLQRFTNPESFMEVFEDKNFLPMFAERVGIKIPETLVYKVKTFYYNSNHERISEEEAVRILQSERSFIIKPSVGTCGGNGIQILEDEKITEANIRKLFSKYQTNFIIQNLVDSHETLKCLHPQSLNTIRIVTYIFNGQIYHVKPIIRMGVSDARVDNACAGGILSGVKSNGYLTEYAMNQYCTRDKMTEHPTTHVVFKNHQVYGMDKIISSAEKLHLHIPQVSFVDWDFTIDAQGEAVLIEANVNKGGGMRLSQWTHGKGAFGENTADILKWIAKAEKMTKSERMETNLFL